MSSGSDENYRRQHRGNPEFGLLPSANAAQRLPSVRSLVNGVQYAPASSRRLASSGERRFFDLHADRHRSIFDHHRSITHEFEDLNQSLEEANSHLRALLDLSNHTGLSSNPPMPPATSTSLRSHQEPADGARRSKRRKIDPDRLAPTFKGFRYGRYGQVEPGPLKMEIESCDGGLYRNEPLYAVENILKNDKSVYCTKGNRCNIILRHQGATVFNLTELTIKAPSSNYSSPVREGMVFMSMNTDHLLTRTARYQIRYGMVRSDDDREACLLEPVISIHHGNDGTAASRTEVFRRRLYSMGSDSLVFSMPAAQAQMPQEFTQSPAPFRITTECSEEDSDDTSPRGESHHTPNRIGSLPFESHSSDDDVYGLSMDDLDHHAYVGRESSDLPMYEFSETARPSREATSAASQSVPAAGELMAPHARFHIEKDHSQCTIRFDPPVACRFILLKMWSPQHGPGSNIDIQAVMATGYAGPRYFPSIDPR